MEKQALRQFLRKQSRAQIPVTLYDIITMSLQLIRAEKRVWLSQDEVNLLSPGKGNRNCRLLTNLIALRESMINFMRSIASSSKLPTDG